MIETDWSVLVLLGTVLLGLTKWLMMILSRLAKWIGRNVK